MKLSVPFNGQDELISQLKDYPEVREVYGKLTSDFIGGGKNSFQIPSISKKKLASSVKEAHKYGLEFDYLLNSSCLDNREWTISGQRKITQLINWIISLDIDAVTVGTPYLLELIKKRYPELKVYISTLAGINRVRQAKYWQDLGADRITLLNVDVNRKFLLLKRFKEEIKCDLKLILNSNCLYECPFYMHHANVASHASQSEHCYAGFIIDYCRIRCRYQQIIEPIHFIRSTWIRPEDLCHYENIGIDYFKIIDRGMTTQTILSVVKAYVNRDYKGNLLDLFPDPSKSIIFKQKSILHKFRYFLRPFLVNMFKLRKFVTLLNNAVYIDNKKLDGFLENIINIDCDKHLCHECDYCHKVVANVVCIDKDLNKELEKHYKTCLEYILSGDLFNYFK